MDRILDQIEIGKQIRARRKEMGLSQDDLARLAGLSRLPIHQLEDGNGGTRLENLLAILNVLGLKLTLQPRGSIEG